MPSVYTAPVPEPVSTLTAIARAGSTKRRAAIWLMECTACGHQATMLARKITSGKARCPECFPSIARAQEKAIQELLPASHADFMEKMGMTKAMAHWRTKKMRGRDLIHIGDWKRTEVVGGSYQPIFFAGPGKDVPCPFKPLSHKTRTRRYIAKLKASDEGREKLDIRRERNRAIYRANRASKRKQNPFSALGL
jgi:hypothetical protein